MTRSKPEPSSATQSRIAINAYRAKAGREQVLLAELRDHQSLLWSEGLATDREPVVMRAGDGTLLEIFEWASPAAIEDAHRNARVKAAWARLEACADFVPLAAVDGAGAPFADFARVSLKLDPIVQPDPDHRAE